MRGWPTALLLCVSACLSACVGQLDPPQPRDAEQFTNGRALVDLAALAEARALADAAPGDLSAQWGAGMAHARASLQGHLELRDHAERYLERAWRLDPDAEQVPAARVLARFLNLRSSVLDLDRLDLQIALYESILDPAELALEPAQMSAAQFYAFGFWSAAHALRSYDDGQLTVALRQLDALERAMQDRLDAHPDDIDTCTMAGNFALTFAGVIPIGVSRRLDRGVEYLEAQQDHWFGLSPRARSRAIAPNVRSVFALFLAEALLADGRVEDAERRYRDLIELEDQPDTAPRRQIVELAEHRLAHLDAYANARELLPPWPAGVTGCVACHSREAALPTDDLYRLPELASP